MPNSIGLVTGLHLPCQQSHQLVTSDDTNTPRPPDRLTCHVHKATTLCELVAGSVNQSVSHLR